MSPRLDRRLAAILLSGLCLAMSGKTLGATLPGKDALATSMLIEEDKDERRGQVFATTGYYYMSSQNLRVSGIEFDAGYHHAQTDKFGFGPRIRQAFSAADGFATLFTGLVLDFTYAITGSLVSVDRSYTLGDFHAASVQQRDAGGVKGIVSVSQFFINTTQVAVPFSGVGVGLRYDLPAGKSFVYTAGLSVDRVTNTKIMIVPVQAFIGVANSL